MFLPLQKHLNAGAPSGAVEARSLKHCMVITSVWLCTVKQSMVSGTETCFSRLLESLAKKATGGIFFLIWVSVD